MCLIKLNKYLSMKINQLFKEKVSEDILNKILEAFHLNGLDDDTVFSKVDLEKYSTVTKIHHIKDQLIQFYLPCKAKIYLDNMDASKCITVLRQVLKLFQVKLVSRQRYIKYRKTTIYSMMRGNEPLIASMKVEQTPHELFFNG